MDGENNGKPYFQMDDLGGKTHYFRKHPYHYFMLVIKMVHNHQTKKNHPNGSLRRSQ